MEPASPPATPITSSNRSFRPRELKAPDSDCGSAEGSCKSMMEDYGSAAWSALPEPPPALRFFSLQIDWKKYKSFPYEPNFPHERPRNAFFIDVSEAFQ